MTTSGAIPSTEPFRSAASKTILNIMSVQPLYLSRSPPSLAFYRAMHFSAKRGIAIACRLSVRPSVCDVGEL